MAWVEIHQSLPTHRKTLALADELNIEPVQAVGHLACLWLWALDNAPDGSLADVSARTLARAALWRKEPQAFADALFAAGLTDADQSIHDWTTYAGRLIERRKKDAERKRTERNGGPDIPPPSNGRPADVAQKSGASHARVNRTQPDRTGPDQIETAKAVLSASADDTPGETSPGDDRVDAVYEHFKARVQPRARICPRKKIAARLKRFTVAELCAGIDNFAADWWRMENNASNGAEWFFDSDAQAEKFLLLQPRAAKVVPMNGTSRRPIDAPPDVPSDSPFLKFREVS